MNFEGIACKKARKVRVMQKIEKYYAESKEQCRDKEQEGLF